MTNIQENPTTNSWIYAGLGAAALGFVWLLTRPRTAEASTPPPSPDGEQPPPTVFGKNPNDLAIFRAMWPVVFPSPPMSPTNNVVVLRDAEAAQIAESLESGISSVVGITSSEQISSVPTTLVPYIAIILITADPIGLTSEVVQVYQGISIFVPKIVVIPIVNTDNVQTLQEAYSQISTGLAGFRALGLNVAGLVPSALVSQAGTPEAWGAEIAQDLLSTAPPMDRIL